MITPYPNIEVAKYYVLLFYKNSIKKLTYVIQYVMSCK